MKKILVVGIGPGGAGDMTARARAALEEAAVLCGYTRYIDLIRHLVPGKGIIATGMRAEAERCRAALATAAEGDTVAVVCSGDAGVYGMAGLLFELAAGYPPVDIEVVPGVTAALSGAALLGAPLMNDFAVVSLSDLLTPWTTIAKRLEGAAAADLVLVLYNPASRRRADHLARACDSILCHRERETVCGWVRNAGRDGEEHAILSLGALREWRGDMFSTVFVGNRATRVVGGRMVTPRGYPDAPS